MRNSTAEITGRLHKRRKSFPANAPVSPKRSVKFPFFDTGLLYLYALERIYYDRAFRLDLPLRLPAAPAVRSGSPCCHRRLLSSSHFPQFHILFHHKLYRMLCWTCKIGRLVLYGLIPDRIRPPLWQTAICGGLPVGKRGNQLICLHGGFRLCL